MPRRRAWTALCPLAPPRSAFAPPAHPTTPVRNQRRHDVPTRSQSLPAARRAPPPRPASLSSARAAPAALRPCSRESQRELPPENVGQPVTLAVDFDPDPIHRIGRRTIRLSTRWLAGGIRSRSRRGAHSCKTNASSVSSAFASADQYLIPCLLVLGSTIIPSTASARTAVHHPTQSWQPSRPGTLRESDRARPSGVRTSASACPSAFRQKRRRYSATNPVVPVFGLPAGPSDRIRLRAGRGTQGDSKSDRRRPRRHKGSPPVVRILKPGTGTKGAGRRGGSSSRLTEWSS